MDPQGATWEQGLTQAATILKQHKVPPPPPKKDKHYKHGSILAGERTFIIKKYTKQRQHGCILDR